MRKRFLATVMIMFSAAVLLSACGKVSSPEPIEGSGYPHAYPRH